MDDGDSGGGGVSSSSSSSDSSSSNGADGYGGGGGGYGGGTDNSTDAVGGNPTDAVGGSVDPGTYAGAFAGTDQTAVAAGWNAAVAAAATDEAQPAAAPEAQPAVMTQAQPAAAPVDPEAVPDEAVALAQQPVAQLQPAVVTDEDQATVDEVAQRPRPNAEMTMSPEGYAELAAREEQVGVSLHTHWPGAASGVTIGPGYDMGNRTADEVSNDLQAVGVPAATADTLAQGAGLTGAAAKAFAVAHRGDVSLTDDQQASLLSNTVPPYQAAVQNDTTTPLTQNQFDALVSYTYQEGAKGLAKSQVLGLVNSGQLSAVPGELNRGNPTPGQVSRRAGEAAQFAR